MKCVLLVTGLLCGHAMAAGLFPAPGITIGGPVDSNTVRALGATNALSNAIRAGRVLTLEEFGAAGDGVTDDTQAFVKATAAAASTANVQGARIALLHKRYYLANGGTIPAGVSVAGPGDPGNDAPGWDPTIILPLLVLGRGAGVTLTVNGNLANTGVARAGVNLAPAHIQDAMANLANYTGTGVTIGPAARVQNIITLGNALGYQVENANEWHADTLRSDDLASIWIDNMHDVSTVRDFEAFPWLTARDAGANHQRHHHRRRRQRQRQPARHHQRRTWAHRGEPGDDLGRARHGRRERAVDRPRGPGCDAFRHLGQ